MKILFDEEIFALQRFGGISRYFSEIMACLAQKGVLANPGKSFSSNEHYNEKQLARWEKKHMPRYGKTFISKALHHYDKRNFNKLLVKQKYDLLHLTYYGDSVLKMNSKPVVSTVYDMIHESFFNDYLHQISPETIKKNTTLVKSDKIISISNATKQSLLEHIPALMSENIEVIYLAASQPVGSWKDLNIDLPQKYILFTGNRKYYKNFYWLAKSLRPLLLSGSYTLLCAGGGAFDAYDLSFIERLGLSDCVKHISFKNDEELFHIYSKAHCFVFPSLMEGFGIPTLEAMSAGCPVILTDIPVFREVAEDAAMYFKPDDSEQLLDNIQKLQQKEIREEMIHRGLQRSKFFSWEKCVNEHIELYKSLL